MTMNQRIAMGLPLTPVVKKILIVNAVIWLIEVLFVHWAGSTSFTDHLALTPSRVIPGFEMWQPITYMWLHDYMGIMHVLLNCLMLWMFGGQLELLWGARAFFRFYMICGVGAGVAVFGVGSLLNPDVPTLGASGAVDGIMVAWAIVNWNRRFMFFGIIPMTGKHFMLVTVGMVAVQILLRTPGVSNTAHIAGMLIAALLVTGYWRPGKIRKKFRYWWLRRRLKVLEGDKKGGPPSGGYWH